MGRARGGAGVVLTRLGGVEALRAGPYIEAGGARSSGVPSSGPWVGARGWGDAGLGVEAEELIVLSSWRCSSTLRLATLVAYKLNLPVNFRFASTPDRRLDLLFEVKPSKAWGLGEGDGLSSLGCRRPCHPPRSTLSRSAMVVSASGGWGRARFYARRPPSTPHTCASSCKEHGRAWWGGPPP